MTAFWGFPNLNLVYTSDDVDLAIHHGLNGIIVSNHGGRQLDTVPASLDVLREVGPVAKGRIPVAIDGGIRRGTDIFKALALGADFVMAGRPAIWGLAVSKRTKQSNREDRTDVCSTMDTRVSSWESTFSTTSSELAWLWQGKSDYKQWLTRSTPDTVVLDAAPSRRSQKSICHCCSQTVYLPSCRFRGEAISTATDESFERRIHSTSAQDPISTLMIHCANLHRYLSYTSHLWEHTRTYPFA